MNSSHTQTCAIILFLFIFKSTDAQTPNWSWTKVSTGDIYSQCAGQGIYADTAGNSYVTGYFLDTITLGANILTSPYESSTYQTTSLFTAKYDVSGNVLWVSTSKNNSINSNCESNAITLDRSGNIYITGYFQDTIIVGGDTLINPINPLSDNGWIGGGILIVKFDQSGNVIWAKTAENQSINSTSSGNAICTDNAGNIYVTGYFQDTIKLGNITLMDTVNNNCSAVFTAKLNPMGDVIWAESTQTGLMGNVGGAADAGNGICLDDTGNVYITGVFMDTINFGTYTLVASPAPTRNCFIAKYDSSGNLIWAESPRTISVNSTCVGTSICTDSRGSIYLTGGFKDTVSFGGDTLICGANFNAFTAKYDSRGDMVRVKNIKSSNSVGYEIVRDVSGYIYTEGTFLDTLILAGDTIISPYGIYITKSDSAGDMLWVKSSTGKGGTYSGGLGFDGSGNIYATGSFSDTITFGNNTFDETNTTIYFFIAKLSDSVSTGTSDIKTISDGISIYPNPTSGLLRIDLSGLGHSSIRMYDEMGQEIYSTPLNAVEQNQSLEIDLHAFSDGIYLISAIDPNETISKRIVIRK